MKSTDNTITFILNSRPYFKVKTKLWNDKYYIGYSHLIKVGDYLPDELSKKQAKDLLIKDVDLIVRQLKKLIKVTVNQNQFDALISLVYDIGIKTFRSSSLLDDLNKENYVSACAQIRRWSRYKKTPIYRLIKTRNLEINLFNSPLE